VTGRESDSFPECRPNREPNARHGRREEPTAEITILAGATTIGTITIMVAITIGTTITTLISTTTTTISDKEEASGEAKSQF
jgi:hypothetical protein